MYIYMYIYIYIHIYIYIYIYTYIQIHSTGSYIVRASSKRNFQRNYSTYAKYNALSR